MAAVAFEEAVVELGGLGIGGGEDGGCFVEEAEAGEEGDEFGLDDGLGAETVLDDEGEEPAELVVVGADLEEEVAGDEGRRRSDFEGGGGGGGGFGRVEGLKRGEHSDFFFLEKDAGNG